MKAVVLKSFGNSSVLQTEEREPPEITADEVLIKVAAAGVNRPDIMQRQGKYPAPPGAVQDILGLEVSGTIHKIGKNVRGLNPGQAVIALVPGGGYAEYVAVDAGSCLPVPFGISIPDAAALPEVLFTVWHNVFQRGNLQKGEDALIYGGSGGIGSMAIQLVNLFGANPLTLVSSKEKETWCRGLGASKVINYKEEDLLFELGKESVDLILDSVGGPYLPVNLDLLRKEGRLVYINAMEGHNPEFNIMKLMQKRLWITGSTLRPRSFAFKRKLAQDILLNAYPLIESRKFKNMVTHRFPAEKAAEAHDLMESRDFTGKIILQF